jgi:RNA polymerase sigma-70 factor, ECF subfamily
MTSRRPAPAVLDGPRPDAETSRLKCAAQTQSAISEGSMTRAVVDLRAPDQRVRDEAARRIWERFAQRLSALVRHRLNAKIRVREDENDIVQSMFQSFFAVQQNQGYPLKNREELWRFLVWMTMCKVANTAHHHQRARRDIRREQSLAPSSGEVDFSASVIAEIADLTAISPEDEAISRIELARILGRLRKDLRQIIVWKLNGHTNAEIGRKAGRTERTVEIKMRLIRQTLGRDPGVRDELVGRTSYGSTPTTDHSV